MLFYRNPFFGITERRAIDPLDTNWIHAKILNLYLVVLYGIFRCTGTVHHGGNRQTPALGFREMHGG